ncbi:hypothetical protein BDN67DRAFT_985458 [Paxillus ammoniavirescens]|nr:hypothetical protein BDN67DRAFT_985458 [Paxillus ammoniavirescens]
MSDNVQAIHTSRPLVEDRSAWHLVMQWAEEQIQFPMLCDTLAEQFGDRYVYADWTLVFDVVFTASEDGQDTCIAAVWSSLKSQGKRRKLDSGNSPRQHKRVHPFLDLEAQHGDDEEETMDEEVQDPFFVPDGTIEDGPIPSTAWPSHYTRVVDTIAQRFEDSMGDRSEDSISEDEDTTVLDTTGIWEMIRDWLSSTLLYEKLMRHIDFQYGKYLNIQYWEDFVSDLAFKGVDERQGLFKSIVLDKHRRRLAHYVSPVVPRPTITRLPALTRRNSHEDVVSSSASYIASMWNKAGLTTSKHKLLQGCVTVSALDPSTFIHALPLSHSSSVNCYSLVPTKEYIHPFGIAALKPQVPDPTCRDRDNKISQDQKACCLFKPELYGGAVQPSICGMACYSYKCHTILVCDAAHRGKRGLLLMIAVESQSATMELLEGGEYIIPLSDLQHHYVVGDVVRVIEDPHSDLWNIHHQAIGKFGNVSHIDFDTDEITFVDSMGSEIRVPSFLLESYVPDQHLWTPFSSLSLSIESPAEDIQSGNIADVVAGLHVGVRGAVTRDGVGRSGVVSQVDLDKKVLKVTSTWNPSDVFTLPITRFARSDAFRNREDENQRHRSKEVLIIGGHYKGWRGSLISVGKDTCVVARGNSALETCETSMVVVRGEHATLNGILLTPAQSIKVLDAFAQGQHPEVVNRKRTPPPEGPSQPVASSSFTPWSVDGDDIAGLNALTPTSAFEILRHPSVTISLQQYHAVFKIKPGWKDTYANHHTKAKVPDPFQSPSGPAPSGHIAVCFTARTKGATLLHETIPERCLEPVAPPQKNTFCMVISSKEGGEGIGMILTVKKTSTKEKQVTVV